MIFVAPALTGARVPPDARDLGRHRHGRLLILVVALVLRRALQPPRPAAKPRRQRVGADRGAAQAALGPHPQPRRVASRATPPTSAGRSRPSQRRARRPAGEGTRRGRAGRGHPEPALGRLFAVAEAYPELQADENFRQLQTELAETENRVAVSRQVYNDTVLTYNNAIQTFPGARARGPVRVHDARVLRGRGRGTTGGAGVDFSGRDRTSRPRRLRVSSERSRSPSRCGRAPAPRALTASLCSGRRRRRRRSRTARSGSASGSRSPSGRLPLRLPRHPAREGETLVFPSVAESGVAFRQGTQTSLEPGHGRHVRRRPARRHDADRLVLQTPATRHARSRSRTRCAASQSPTTTSSTSTSRSGVTSGTQSLGRLVASRGGRANPPRLGQAGVGARRRRARRARGRRCARWTSRRSSSSSCARSSRAARSPRRPG